MQRIVRTPIGILSLSCPELSDRADAGGAVVSLAAAPAIAEYRRTAGAFPPHNEPIAVVLDFVHPVGPRRRLGG
jgi:hypothetical protein